MNAEDPDRPKPIDAEVGEETDVQRTALTITPGDVRAVVVSAAPAHERLAELETMKADIAERIEADPDDTLEPIARDLDHAIEAVRRQLPDDQ